jgi:hypothetical protein
MVKRQKIPKGVIRNRKLKDIQFNGQKLEDIKGVIRSRKSKQDRQHNGQKKKDKGQ